MVAITFARNDHLCPMVHMGVAVMAETGILFAYGRLLREKLQKAGAVSKETAKTIEELGLSGREIRTLKRNVWAGKIKEVVDDKGKKRYYVPCEEKK